MNRKQRRKESTHKKDNKALKIINQSYQKGLEDGVKQASEIAFKEVATSFILFLHDKKGWKKKRCTEVLMYVQKELECTIENRVTLEDKLQVIKEEMDIEIT